MSHVRTLALGAAVALALFACGKYGPPVRSVGPPAEAAPAAEAPGTPEPFAPEPDTPERTP